jgi:hypothetical protein
MSLQLNAARYLVEQARFSVHAAEVASVCLYAITTFAFGPTTESLVDPRTELATMLETALAITVLVVLAARIVARG